MELTFIEQTYAFFYSILLGAALGAVYEIFKIIRTVFFAKKLSTFIIDVIFMVTVFLSVFYFCMAFLYGYIRIYVFFGCGIGFLIYKFTLGRLLSKVYCPVIYFVKRVMKKIISKFKKIAEKLLKICKKILYNINEYRKTTFLEHFFTSKNKEVMKNNGKHSKEKV